MHMRFIGGIHVSIQDNDANSCIQPVHQTFEYDEFTFWILIGHSWVKIQVYRSSTCLLSAQSSM